MAGITVSGLGSGLDVKGIVDTLVSAEQTRFSPKEQKAADVKTRLSAYSRVKTSLSNLQDVAKRIQTLANKTTRADVTDASLFTVNATSGAAAANYELTINKSAQAKRLESQTFAASSLSLGAGSVGLRLGGSDFSANILGSDDLRTVVDKINASTDASGVSLASTGFKASIITANSGVKVVLEGPSGAVNDFTLSINEGTGSDPTSNTDDSGLSRLAFGVKTAQDARDASVSIKRNGSDIGTFTNSSNTFGADITGITNVSFSIKKTIDAPTEKPATLTVSTVPDNDGIKAALKDLVREVNATMATLKNNQKKGGQLESETTPVRLMASIRNVLASSKDGNTLNSLGLSFSKEGVLNLNESAFDQAVQGNPLLANSVFGDAASNSSSGIAKELAAMLAQATGTEGLLSTRAESLNRVASQIDKDRTRFDDSIVKLRKRLTAQFASLDTTVAQLQQSSGVVAQRLASLQNSGNNQ